MIGVVLRLKFSFVDLASYVLSIYVPPSSQLDICRNISNISANYLTIREYSLVLLRYGMLLPLVLHLNFVG